MKKFLKKMTAWIAGTVLATMPVLASALVVHADEILPMNPNWTTYKYDSETNNIKKVDTGIPVNFNFSSSVENQKIIGLQAFYVDFDEMMADAPQEVIDRAASSGYIHTGEMELYMRFSKSFVEGDSLSINFPYPIQIIDFDYGGEEQWKITNLSSTGVSFICTATGDFAEDANWLGFGLVYVRNGSALEDQFWFIPMKTQLNIAAEIASTSGKEAVAEVSGNFALSYEIMKWLEDHPNVTLKYNLTYKEKDYNIVIKGGQKLANPEIPWYGPEYLIGKFSK